MVHPQKFKDNENLFINREQFNNENDTDEDEEEKNSNYRKNNWATFTNINNSDDEGNEHMEDTTSKKEKKESNKGKHKHFTLELIYVNRIIKTNASNITSKLLSFEHHQREKESIGIKSSKHKAVQSLKDCIEYFRQTEKLEKENAWYCNKCKDHVEAFKRIELYSVPPVLIFCLQRFKSHNIYFKEKLEDKIVFPI